MTTSQRKRKDPPTTHTQLPIPKLPKPSLSFNQEDSTPPRKLYSCLTIDVPSCPDMCGTVEPCKRLISRKQLETSVGGIVLNSSGKGTLSDTMGKYSVCLHRGRRKLMEDSFLVTTNNDNGVYGVFDGHGSQGSECATLCSDTVNEYAKSFGEWNMKVETGFKEALDRAHEASLESIEKGGSTACCAYVSDSKLWVANIGDSRCVLSKKGTAIPLSRDHKPDDPEERKRVESQGGQVVYYNGWRVEGILSVSRSLGNKNLAAFLSAEAELTEHDIASDDDFIILATDGLWAVMDSQAAVDIVRAELNKAGVAGLDVSSRAQRVTEALVEEALDIRNSPDNICCIVVFLN